MFNGKTGCARIGRHSQRPNSVWLWSSWIPSLLKLCNLPTSGALSPKTQLLLSKLSTPMRQPSWHCIPIVSHPNMAVAAMRKPHRTGPLLARFLDPKHDVFFFLTKHQQLLKQLYIYICIYVCIYIYISHSWCHPPIGPILDHLGSKKPPCFFSAKNPR